MDKCPHCKNELKLAHHHAEGNVLAYGGSTLTATLCCSNMVRHYRVQFTRIEKGMMPKDRTDDWGYTAPQPLISPKEAT